MSPPAPRPDHVQAVPLPQAYRLLNHGPTVLVSAAHAGLRNLMAAAWAMPLDFDPPKVAVVIDKSSFTRGLIEAAGAFALGVPCRALADLTFSVGSESAHDGIDKFERHRIETFTGTDAQLPLVAGCIAWLECRVLPEPQIALRYDLFLAQVTAAWADARVFRQGRWDFDGASPELRSLHHLSGGAFVSPADLLQARRLP